MGNEATTHAETFHRHGDPDPSNWDEAQAVTGRPADEPTSNSTLAERATARKGDAKQVDADEVEDKAVKKAPARKAKKG